jgi:hypothetical protein
MLRMGPLVCEARLNPPVARRCDVMGVLECLVLHCHIYGILSTWNLAACAVTITDLCAFPLIRGILY